MNAFVSRGGIKLQAAIDQFKLDVSGKVCLDVGSSTGGFVDCLLQNGALQVYAVDTAYGELAWKLRNDPRVVVMERTNVLHLEALPSHDSNDRVIYGKDGEKVDLITIDSGWTKLELVLPVVKKFLKPDGIIIALLKPHYEADRNELDHGVVKPEFLEQVRGRVFKTINDLGFTINDWIESPILGSKGKGNKEFLLKISIGD